MTETVRVTNGAFTVEPSPMYYGLAWVAFNHDEVPELTPNQLRQFGDALWRMADALEEG